VISLTFNTCFNSVSGRNLYRGPALDLWSFPAQSTYQASNRDLYPLPAGPYTLSIVHSLCFSTRPSKTLRPNRMITGMDFQFLPDMAEFTVITLNRKNTLFRVSGAEHWSTSRA